MKNQTLLLIALLSSILLFNSCTFRKGGARNEVAQGHFQLYSHPDYEETKTEETNRRLVIVSTNDLYGHIIPENETVVSPDNQNQKNYPVGGMSYFSTYLKILRERYPNQVMLVDAGDFFQGTLLSNSLMGQPIVDVYEYLGYDAVNIGDNDFYFLNNTKNDDQNYFRNLVKKSKFPYLLSNLYEISSAKNINWENIKPFVIKEVNGIKVGIIGVMTKEILDKSIKEALTGLYIEDLNKAVIRHSHLAKRAGAQVVLLLAHSDILCGTQSALKKELPISKVNFSPNDAEACDSNSELTQMLKMIPPNTVDLVVSGNQLGKVANFIEGVPVAQNFGLGRYFSRIELVYDLKKQRVDQEKTIIYQPTKICHNFFSETEDCFTQDISVNHDLVTTAKFLGQDIYEDQNLKNLIEPFQQKVNKLANQKIKDLENDFPHTKNSLSPFGSFVAETIRKKLNAQISILNANAVQDGLTKGELTYGSLFQSLPHDNLIMRVKLFGRDLKSLIKLSITDDYHVSAYYSGIKISFTGANSQGDDALENETWKRSKNVNLTLEDGTLINDNQVYDVATVNYLGHTSKDSFGQILNNIHYSNKKLYDRNYRDIIAEEIKNNRLFENVIIRFNSAANTLQNHSQTK
ncbi:MAG: 5'-nucleotidase C-terminal domain-containing protein [Bacteriovoracaceae bacterium]|nr:5'-nucleotidase C-terminal domain-containing protein [Bacteriovoracaceae bacterium]